MEQIDLRDQALKGVRDAVEVLYETFARYGATYPLEACTCGCVEDGEQKSLFSGPLRELGSDQIGRYWGKAITTWGTVDDFKHFLPRILELMVLDDHHCGRDPCFVISKFVHGEWQSWPVVEQEAIGGFLLAWWRLALTTHPNESATVCCDCVLESAVRMRFELSTLLELWDQAIPNSFQATLQFASFASSVWRCIGRNEPVFSDASRPQTGQLLEWLREPAHLTALTNLQQGALSSDDEVYVQLGHAAMVELVAGGGNSS